MSTPKLSSAMKDELRKLADHSPRQAGLTNQTMCALRRRGYAEVSGIKAWWADWSITDAGRKALSEA